MDTRNLDGTPTGKCLKIAFFTFEPFQTISEICLVGEKTITFPQSYVRGEAKQKISKCFYMFIGSPLQEDLIYTCSNYLWDFFCLSKVELRTHYNECIFTNFSHRLSNSQPSTDNLEAELVTIELLQYAFQLLGYIFPYFGS